MWPIIKEGLRKQVVNRDNLKEKVLEIWDEIDAETVTHLCDSFQGRYHRLLLDFCFV